MGRITAPSERVCLEPISKSVEERIALISSFRRFRHPITGQAGIQHLPTCWRLDPGVRRGDVRKTRIHWSWEILRKRNDAEAS